MYDLTLAPLVPWPVVATLAVATLILVAVALVRGGRGWLFRTIAMAALTAALLNPLIVREQRDLATRPRVGGDRRVAEPDRGRPLHPDRGRPGVAHRDARRVREPGDPGDPRRARWRRSRNPSLFRGSKGFRRDRAGTARWSHCVDGRADPRCSRPRRGNGPGRPRARASDRHAGRTRSPGGDRSGACLWPGRTGRDRQVHRERDGSAGSRNGVGSGRGPDLFERRSGENRNGDRGRAAGLFTRHPARGADHRRAGGERGGRRGVDAQQSRRRDHQWRARSVEGAAGLGTAAPGRTDVAQSAEVGSVRGSDSFHDPASARKGRHDPSSRVVPDRFSGGRAVREETP